MALCFFLQGLPIVLLFWAQAPGSSTSSLSSLHRMGGEMSAFPIINRQYYGNAPTGTIYGWQMAGAGSAWRAAAFLGAGSCGI